VKFGPGGERGLGDGALCLLSHKDAPRGRFCACRFCKPIMRRAWLRRLIWPRLR
jgi:hypothetical protein